MEWKIMFVEEFKILSLFPVMRPTHIKKPDQKIFLWDFWIKTME